MITVASLIIAKDWEQSKCPSTREWLHKLWFHPYDGILLRNIREQTTDTKPG